MNPMHCDRILELLPGRLDGSLEEGRAPEVETHLRDCPGCAAEAEALKETLTLLRNLPPEKAPPELLEGVRRRIAAETGRGDAGKGLFASARVRIPLEAAAAVLLFLLVYGIQKQIPVTDRPAAPPAARVEATSPSGAPEPGTGAEKARGAEPAVPARGDRKAPLAGRSLAGKTAPAGPTAAQPAVVEPERSDLREPPAAEDRVETVASPTGTAGPGREAPMEAQERRTEAPQAAKASLPAVPVTRVSTGAEPVASRDREGDRTETPFPFRVFAAPPSRLLLPMPYGREVILEVAAEQRPGIEERIVRLVERFGGSILREWHFQGTGARQAGSAPVSEGPMRVQLPADSAGAFLSELRTLGTIPPEGTPGNVDLPAGPTPDVVAYTVRIRVR